MFSVINNNRYATAVSFNIDMSAGSSTSKIMSLVKESIPNECYIFAGTIGVNPDPVKPVLIIILDKGGTDSKANIKTVENIVRNLGATNVKSEHGKVSNLYNTWHTNNKEFFPK